MEMKRVVEMTERIRKRIKKEAKDLKELEELHTKNPELARLCEDIDNIIDSWAWERLGAEVNKRNKERTNDRTRLVPR